ncbi:MAG: uroporphyrinogen-III C-methyltransferase [Candidatus Omnitrophota bacterium]
MANKVYLVGAGPGKPDLITVRGREILRQADVIIYDYLVDKRILEEAKADAELICCDKLGKSRYSDGFLKHNEKINQLVIKKVRQGKKVIRLKNGDVSIFSRTSQELEPLMKEGIEFELVPGVSAASGTSAYSGIPLTDRRFASSVTFVTGHEDPKKIQSSLDWNSLAKNGTLVLYMAVENLSRICEVLINAGKPKTTPVAIIQDASLITQKLLTGNLEDIVAKAKQNRVKPPAVIIIGEAVSLEKRFNWLKQTKKTLFTGISRERFFRKGLVMHLPLIKIVPLGDYAEFGLLLKDISAFDWLVFTSRYAVQYFFERLNNLKLDARSFSAAKVAAIGNSTRNRLLDFGVVADLVPEEESSQGLLKEFKKLDILGSKIFLPRSDIADKGLTEALKAQGAEVISGVAYKNIMPDNLPDLDLNLFDEIMFTSPSGVRNFIKRYGRPPKKIRISCIGDVTAKEAKKYHLL